MGSKAPLSSRSAIGAAISRVEDFRLITGAGRFVDDFEFRNTVYAQVLRSPHAHARISSIDISSARAAPGVLLVLTGEDVVREKLGSMICKFAPAIVDGRGYRPSYPILATDKVRHVGDRVALVVAETLEQARDASELIDVEYEELEAVSLQNALSAGSVKVWDESANNLCMEIVLGDPNQTDEMFLRAAHTVHTEIRYPRISANTMEPRGAIAYFEPTDGRCTICTSTQAPFRVRENICAVLGLQEMHLRVIAPDVGGGFGMKANAYPEEALLVWAARKLGCPVKWTATRGEALLSDMHGRDQMTKAEMAFSADGRILALRAETLINVGAYLAYSAGVPPTNATTSFTSCYDIPLICVRVRAPFTNTAPVGPFRGSGKPEATFVVERLIDLGGKQVGIDAIELRRRNFIRTESMPYKTAGGFVYDSGEFEAILRKALLMADADAFVSRREKSLQRGFLRGFGLSMHCQPSGHQSERMEIRIDPKGSISLYVGTVASGQGHETMFPQMVSGWLGVPMSEIQVFQGDTDRTLFGRGTFAQRSMIAGGSALHDAATQIVENARHLAASMLDAPKDSIDFDDGIFFARGTNKTASLADVARFSYYGSNVPSEVGIGLSGVGTFSGTPSFPNGCMIVEVELDTETGAVTIDRLTAVDDVGIVINPNALSGQLHGSVAHGLGETLLEQVVYDDTGQLLSGSFQDYAMPRASHIPPIEEGHSLVPSKTNPLGVKGGAEAGNVGAPPAIMSAIFDALSQFEIKSISLPATPERIWRALRTAKELTK